MWQLNAFRDAVGRGENDAFLTGRFIYLLGDFSAGIQKQSGAVRTQSEKIDSHSYLSFK